MHKFKKTGARILFGAERYCWPDETVEHLYPNVQKGLPKYLNSGLFIGKYYFLYLQKHIFTNHQFCLFAISRLCIRCC